jgi:hypothetical protein
VEFQIIIFIKFTNGEVYIITLMEMPEKNQRRTVYWFYLPVSLLLLSYVVVRAATLSITYDEAWTMIGFVQQQFMDILSYSPCSTNNHILNTILIKLTVVLSGETVFKARLPNVLAFILYLFYSWRICGFFPNVKGMLAFLVLLLNPFMLDFFGLARGYGLSLAFEMASLYYLILFISGDGRPRHLTLCLVLGGLAVISNFTLINFYFGAAAAMFLHTLIRRRPIWQCTLHALLVTGVLLLIVWEPLRKIRLNGSIDYGGNTGFYHDTLLSLARYTVYSQQPADWIRYLLNIILLAFGLASAGAFIKKEFWTDGKYGVSCVLFVAILSVLAQYHILRIPFVIDRTALFLVPLFNLSFLFVLDHNMKVFAQAAVVALAVLMTLNFFIHANLYKTVSWFYNAHDLEVLNKINKAGEVSGKKLHVGYSWPFNCTFRYYMYNNHLDFIEMGASYYADTSTTWDYYLSLKNSIDQVNFDPGGDLVHKIEKDTFLQFPKEGVYVFKKKEK